jgi:hypothetical protein
MSELSGTDTTSNRRKFRRERRDREDELAAENIVGAPPAMAPLSPPNPAFARESGRRQKVTKDSGYYSGRPEGSGVASGGGRVAESVGSPESHGTWSGMSPASHGGSEDPAERRRRRRLERTRPSETVDFT